MSEKVFINYRKEDSAGYAGRLRDDLADHLGNDRVFIDVDNIALGSDFPAAIRGAIGECAAMVTLIGPRWLAATDAQGRRRIDDLNDWVHVELRTAFELGVRVIPVLLDGTPMPRAGELPEALRGLVNRQAIETSNAYWHFAKQRIIQAITEKGRDTELDAVDPDAAIIARLRDFRDTGTVGDVALVFRALAHGKDAVRTRAQQVIHAVGWKTIAAEADRAARTGDGDAIADLLSGLAALEPHPDTVELLGRLVSILRGDLRNRAILLVEKKRLRLEERMLADLFREHHSPYEIIKALGQGVFTATYLARDRESDLRVAVRVLRQEYVSQDHLRAQFVDLAKRSMHYVHEHLAVTRQSGQFPDKGLYFSVRDYVDGPTLQGMLDNGRRFDPPQSIEIVRQVAAALKPIHGRGEVHGGVKPSNVFICGAHEARLGDPCLPVGAAPLLLKRLLYDFRYVAPECFRVAARVTPSADLYSLGCMAYELLTGGAPFIADDPIELAVLHRNGVRDDTKWCDVPMLACGGLVQRLLRPAPAERPRDVGEVVASLDAELARLGGGATGSPVTLVDTGAPADAAGTQTGLVHTDDPGDAFGTMLSAEPPPGAQSAPDGARVDGPEGQFVGRVVARNWRIVRLIGSGSMGTVFEVEHTRVRHLRRALKLIKGGLEANREIVERFRREVTLMSQVEDAEHIVRVHDFDEEAGFGAFVLMDLIEGPSLRDMVGQQGGLPYQDVLLYGRQIASALQRVHDRGVVHRDVKAANVLVDLKRRKAYLADFGIAKDAGVEQARTDDDTGATRVSQFVGSPRYAAPEQLRLEYPPKPGWDLYAFGVLLYETYTGLQYLPQLRNYGALLRQVGMNEGFRVELTYPTPPPPRFAATIELCLKRDPQERIQSAGELVARLEECERELRAAIVPAPAAAAPDNAASAPRSAVETAEGQKGDDLQFTVYRPDVIRPEHWHPLLAFAHLGERPADAAESDPDPREVVRQMANARLGAQRPAYDVRTADSLEPLPRGGEITFIPVVPGVVFNPPRHTFRWLKSAHMAEFELRAGAELGGQTVRGHLSAYWGVVLLADIPLKLRVAGAGAETIPPAPVSVAARMYSKIFASYSRKDAAIVDVLEDCLNTLGYRYLRDIRDVRAGEVWSDRLAQLIAEADVFQLFWSHNSMRSPFVRREWEYALSLARPAFVRPTYWEEPFPEAQAEHLPPESLRCLHFQQLTVVPHMSPRPEASPRPDAGSMQDGSTVPTPSRTHDATIVPSAPSVPKLPTPRAAPPGPPPAARGEDPTRVARPPARAPFAADDARFVPSAPPVPRLPTPRAAPPEPPPAAMLPASPGAPAGPPLAAREVGEGEEDHGYPIFDQYEDPTRLARPHAQARFALRRVQPLRHSGTTTLAGSAYWVGRSPTCDIRLYSPSASREHARLIVRGGVWYMVPCEGKTVFVDGQASQGEVLLRGGMRFCFGEDELVVIDRDAPAEIPEAGAPAGAGHAPRRLRARRAIIVGAVMLIATLLGWLLLNAR